MSSYCIVQLTSVKFCTLIKDDNRDILIFFPPWSSNISTGGHGGRVVTLSPPTSEVRGSIPVTALSGKAGSCLPLVGSLQYTTLANSMYWFPLPFQLPVVI